MFGIDVSHVQAAFDAIDADSDGEISKVEYLHAADRFFASYQPSNFFGLLVDMPTNVL